MPTDLVERLIAGETVRHLVVGDVGSGKSWFAGQVADAARSCGLTVVEVGCVEFETDVPFLPLALVLSQVGVSAGDHAALDAVLGGGGEPQNPLTLGATVADVLHERSTEAPVLIVVDDAHWADADSLQVLLFAARRLDVASVGFIFTALPGVNTRIDRCGLDQLGLERWTDDQVFAQLVAAGFSTAAARASVPLTAGNALAVDLLISTVDDEQRAGLAPLPPAMAIPTAVAARVGLEPHDLSSDVRLTLAVAAVLPNVDERFFDGVLARCGVPPEVRDDRAVLEMVQLEPTVVWASPIVRSAAIRLVDRASILKVHQHVADAAGDAGLEDLALQHRAAAGIGVNDELAAQLEDVGYRAIERGALLTAAESFRQAAVASADLAEKSRRFSLAADLAFAAGNSEQAVPYARAAAEAGEGEHWAIATTRLGEALLWTEGWAISDRTLTDGARLVGEKFPKHSAAMLTHATLQAIVALDTTAAAERYAQAQLAADRSDDDVVKLATPVVGAAAEALAGATARTDPILAESVDLAMAALDYQHPIGSAIAELVGFGAVLREDMDQGIGLLRASNDAGRRTGSVGLAAITAFLLTDALWRSGHWTQAQVEIGLAVNLARDSGFEFLAECGEGYRAWSLAATGRRAECIALSELSLARTEPLQLRFLSIWAHAAMGLAALTDQDPDAAVDAYDRLDALWTQGAVREPNLLWWQGDHVEALALAGHRSRAKEALDRLHGDAELTQRPHAFAMVAKGRALLSTDRAQREQHFSHAIEQLSTCDAPFDLARCLLARGEHRMQHQTGEAGMVDLAEARVLFDRLGAHPWSERASASRNTAHSAPSGLSDVLSEAELRVALVIAGGAQNKEAAEQLYVSTKTVEYHLSNIYRKLQLRSRVDLARYVSERV